VSGTAVAVVGMVNVVAAGAAGVVGAAVGTTGGIVLTGVLVPPPLPPQPAMMVVSTNAQRPPIGTCFMNVS
jgi:hypothetical protein